MTPFGQGPGPILFNYRLIRAKRMSSPYALDGDCVYGVSLYSIKTIKVVDASNNLAYFDRIHYSALIKLILYGKM